MFGSFFEKIAVISQDVEYIRASSSEALNEAIRKCLEGKKGMYISSISHSVGYDNFKMKMVYSVYMIFDLIESDVKNDE